MAIEVIDGTIESTVLKRSNPRSVLYDHITIRTTEGSERRLDKVAAAPEVAALLQPGTDGRFYGYKAIDHRGLFGVRTRDGRSPFAIPTGNEQIMMMMTFAGLGAFIVLLLLGKAAALLALAFGGLGAFAWFRYRSTRIEARARFDADSEITRSFA
jgi:hypothetical protein